MVDFSDRALLIDRLNEIQRGGIVPHNTALGLSVEDCGPGMVVMRLPYAPHLVGNPITGVLHGGAITSLLDAASGLAVFMKLDQPHRIATVDLRIDYLRPATPEMDVLTRAECYEVTRTIAFVRAVAYQDGPERPVAAASGTFMIFRDAKSPVGSEMERGL